MAIALHWELWNLKNIFHIFQARISNKSYLKQFMQKNGSKGTHFAKFLIFYFNKGLNL